MMPFHTQKEVCANCGHPIYYQCDHWEHFTRVYTSSLPYTTKRCYGPGNKLRNWWINGRQATCCGCEDPVPNCSETKEEKT